MKLYVCYGTWKPAPRPGGHPCGVAYHALKDAGHGPEVKLAYGLGILPDALNNLTPGRREVKRLTGNYWVPALVLDDGTVIQGSREIADWAQANPPAATSTATASV
ncbi:MAG TPA: glutathione S-transferase N-terminal domain-containing protein [Solirubrobacteraceae bacterium]|nr:glutathione S-transferase N-terminal domain-containing protein [Solirubrobacteraceae bacterium]